MADIRAQDEPSIPYRSTPTGVPIMPGSTPPGATPPVCDPRPNRSRPPRRRWWVFALGVAVGLAPIGIIARVLLHVSGAAPALTSTSPAVADTTARSLTIASVASSPATIGLATQPPTASVRTPEVSVLTASAPIEAATTAPASTVVAPRPTTTAAAAGATNATRPIPTFDDGIHVVGEDVQPGRYILTDAADGCYWARLRSVDGALTTIVANDNVVGQVVVDILAADAAFESVGCGTWIAYLGAYPTSSFADGEWVVPTQVAAGRWQAPGGAGCHWARLRDFADTVDSVIASQVKRGPVVVDVEPGDEGFESKRCGTWTLVHG